ncbi:response regulator transcription factor [Oscillatoria sp. FACHB-1407]|nr:response regulator transcription factor [Oscillatoria sp. FACHB-1407]
MIASTIFKILMQEVVMQEAVMQEVEDHDSNSVKPTPDLSARELEVLQLLVEGLSNPEIAAHLYLSPNTVKTHVRGILNKLGVQHRLQAAVAALRLGLV